METRKAIATGIGIVFAIVIVTAPVMVVVIVSAIVTVLLMAKMVQARVLNIAVVIAMALLGMKIRNLGCSDGSLSGNINGAGFRNLNNYSFQATSLFDPIKSLMVRRYENIFSFFLF